MRVLSVVGNQRCPASPDLPDKEDLGPEIILQNLTASANQQ